MSVDPAANGRFSVTPLDHNAVNQPSLNQQTLSSQFASINNNNCVEQSQHGVANPARVDVCLRTSQSNPTMNAINGYHFGERQSQSLLDVDPTTLELMDDDDLDW